MYPVSHRFAEAMKRPVQRHRIKGMVNGIAFTERNILSGSFTMTSWTSCVLREGLPTGIKSPA